MSQARISKISDGEASGFHRQSRRPFGPRSCRLGACRPPVLVGTFDVMGDARWNRTPSYSMKQNSGLEQPPFQQRPEVPTAVGDYEDKHFLLLDPIDQSVRLEEGLPVLLDADCE